MKSFETVTVAQLPAFADVIDVRSPAEYALDHIPGALNAPVLDDAERAEVGRLYKQVSPFAARRLGAALVARNIGTHMRQHFHDKPAHWRPVVYCWRGGQRSGAMALVLRQVGWQAAQLVGGYKAFRRAVVAQTAELAPRYRYVVLCGATGSGKSAVLEALSAHGAQVLDLERLASHRGSLLGSLPDQPQPSQKGFETQLWQQLRGFDPARPVYVEAESRKIGQLRIPDPLAVVIRSAPCVRIEAPLETRVDFLLRSYRFLINEPDRLRQRLQPLRPLYGGATLARWEAWINAEQWEALVHELLQLHYDRLYRHSTQRHFSQAESAESLHLETLEPSAFSGAAAELSQRFEQAAGKFAAMK